MKEYVRSVYPKIGVESRLAAALWALRIGQMHEAGTGFRSTKVPSTGGAAPSDWVI